MDFDQVYRAFFRDVLFYVWGLCGDRVLAEEIAQETFFKALKSIDRFDGQGDIRPWLFAISKNTYYDHCRNAMTRGSASRRRTGRNGGLPCRRPRAGRGCRR